MADRSLTPKNTAEKFVHVEDLNCKDCQDKNCVNSYVMNHDRKQA